MSSKTDICNYALVRIGVQQQLANVDTDTSQEAVTLALIFNTERDFVLRDFPWPFATGYATLNFASNFLTPANGDWQYAYRLPADDLFTRRLVTANSRQETNPPAFVIGRDPAFSLAAAWSGATAYVTGNLAVDLGITYECISGHTNHEPPNVTYWRVVSSAQLLFTNQASAQIEYTAQVTSTLEFGPAFVSMLAWRLAARLALGLSRMPELAQACEQAYMAEKQQAVSRAAAEAESILPAGDLTHPRVQEMLNLAMDRIGVDRSALGASGNQLSLTGLWPRLRFADQRDFVLRDFAWPWATKYAALAGQAASPNPDWAYSYTYPADALYVRRLTTANGRQELNPPAFRIGRDVSNNRVIFSDAITGSVEYTMQVTDPAEFDAVFMSMLAWRLALQLAPVLATDKTKIGDVLQLASQSYVAEKQQAETLAALEGQKDLPVDISDSATQEIVNLALLRIGVTKDLDPAAGRSILVEARLAKIAFIRERDFVLRDFPWSWAKAYATPVLFAGGTTAPFNRDWIFAYTYPADSVVIRRILNPAHVHHLRRSRHWQFSGSAFREIPYQTIAGGFGTVTITSTANAANNDTLTVGGKVYTFKTTLTGAANEVLIGADAATSALHLAEAINAGANIGVDYGAGTTANASVQAMVYANVLTVSGLAGANPAWSMSSANITLSPAASLQTGRLVLSNEPHITIEYTRQLASPSEFDLYDRAFASMLAWRLAADLAPSRISDVKTAEMRKDKALQAYVLEKSQAQVENFNEGEMDPPDDAEWVRGR